MGYSPIGIGKRGDIYVPVLPVHVLSPKIADKISHLSLEYSLFSIVTYPVSSRFRPYRYVLRVHPFRHRSVPVSPSIPNVIPQNFRTTMGEMACCSKVSQAGGSVGWYVCALVDSIWCFSTTECDSERSESTAQVPDGTTDLGKCTFRFLV